MSFGLMNKTLEMTYLAMKREYMKTCNTCGKGWDYIPDTAKEEEHGALAGLYWECDCGSTLFIPKTKYESTEG